MRTLSVSLANVMGRVVNQELLQCYITHWADSCNFPVYHFWFASSKAFNGLKWVSSELKVVLDIQSNLTSTMRTFPTANRDLCVGFRHKYGGCMVGEKDIDTVYRKPLCVHFLYRFPYCSVTATSPDIWNMQPSAPPVPTRSLGASLGSTLGSLHVKFTLKSLIPGSCFD